MIFCNFNQEKCKNPYFRSSLVDKRGSLCLCRYKIRNLRPKWISSTSSVCNYSLSLTFSNFAAMSQFLHKKEPVADSFDQEIDFDDAIRLPEGGSTCEIYRTRWQRRDVFVKRLKGEYRSNPLYLDALDKEYEIGISLKHPCLPDYRMISRDYIVLDYIDGETLADMLKRKDPWLSSEKNIIRILRELVDVTDYLHRHKVTHCDIKPDNIMVTFNNRNVVLIDLDKCYTDAFNDTSGDPSRYGLSEIDAGKIAIDFHGLGRIAEKLKEGIPNFKFRRYKQFIKGCYDPNVSEQDLLKILDYKPNNPYRKFYWMVSFAPFCVALLYGFVLWLTQDKDGDYDGYGEDVPAQQITDTFKIRPKDESVKDIELLNKSNIKTENIILVPRSQEQIHEEAKVMAVELDKRIQPYYDELNADIDSLISFSNLTGIGGGQLLEKLRKHGDKEEEYIHETFSILNEIFPNLTERETWRVLAYSKAYTQYKRRAEPILGELGMKVKELGNYEYLLESQ